MKNHILDSSAREGLDGLGPTQSLPMGHLLSPTLLPGTRITLKGGTMETRMGYKFISILGYSSNCLPMWVLTPANRPGP